VNAIAPSWFQTSWASLADLLGRLGRGAADRGVV